jgi:ubiquinone/menaquinone biosynthesis C-methylase UbiE
MPNVPGSEAFMREAPHPPAEVAEGDRHAVIPAPERPTASAPLHLAVSPAETPGIVRRRSRRSLRDPEDNAAPAGAEPLSDPPPADGGAARKLSSSAPAKTYNSPPPPNLVLPPEEANASATDGDPSLIQPMRIINIGPTESAAEVSARASSRPPDADLAPHASSRPPPGDAPAIPKAPRPPSFTNESEPVEFVSVDVDEDVPSTQPSEEIGEAARSEELEALEEIEPEAITDPKDQAASAPAPKKPPPPPPKRSTTDAAPNSLPTLQAVPTLQVPPSQAATPSVDKAAADAGDPLRRRQKPWWEELFGDDFTRTMDHLDHRVIRKECDFIEDRLGLEKGAVMLDLCCGPGAHAVELAHRGYSVVGYDLSLAMLARAADEAQERGQKLNFLQGDMREMAFEETFDGVYCWSMSFGYFDDEKNLDVLSRIRRALRKGGMLLLDITNRDYVAPRQPSLVWFEGEGCVCMDEMCVDFFTSRLRVKRTVMFEDGRSKEVDYSIRLYTLHELGKMLHECGFKVIEITGHPAHPGVFFGSESPRIIVLAERD